MNFIQFCPVLPSFAQFCPVFSNFIQFLPVFISFAKILNEFCPVLPSFAQFCPVLPSFAQFCRILNLSESNRITVIHTASTRHILVASNSHETTLHQHLLCYPTKQQFKRSFHIKLFQPPFITDP